MSSRFLTRTVFGAGQKRPEIPGAPSVTLSVGNGQITIAWVDGVDGGKPISSHMIYVNGSELAPFNGPSPYVLKGLRNGIPLSISVAAVNTVGLGGRSGQVSAVPGVAPAGRALLTDGLLSGAVITDPLFNDDFVLEAI